MQDGVRRCWRIFLCGWAALGTARGQASSWNGEVEGEIRMDADALGLDPGRAWTADALAGLELRWAVKMGAEGVIVEASRPGVVIELLARPEAGGAWSWELTRGEIAVNEVWVFARRLLGETAGAWSASGRIDLGGAGRWSPEAGLSGTARASLREGWAKSEALKTEASGLEFDVECADLTTGALSPGQAIRAERVTAGGAELRKFRLGFGLGADGVIAVEGGELEALGGRARLRPFRAPLEKLASAGAARLDVEGLQLAQAAGLLPWLFKSAQGRLSGGVEMTWRGGELALRDGGLDIVKTDEAEFRFAPGVVAMTRSVPDKLRLFPDVKWLRWIGLNNPAYAPLKNIESGREGLRIEEFRVDFWPDGAGAGRPMTIHVVGKPTEEALVESVTLDVNFHGPLAEVIGFGMNREFGSVDFQVE